MDIAVFQDPNVLTWAFIICFLAAQSRYTNARLRQRAGDMFAQSRGRIVLGIALCFLFYGLLFLEKFLVQFTSGALHVPDFIRWLVYIPVGAGSVVLIAWGLALWVVQGRYAEVEGSRPPLYTIILDNLWLAAFFLFIAPAVFLLVRSLWHPIIDELAPLHVWAALFQQQLNTISFGAIEELRRGIVPPLTPPTALQPGETIAFNVVESLFFLSFMSGLLKDTWAVGRRASAQEWVVALVWLAIGVLLIAGSITLVASNFQIWADAPPAHDGAAIPQP